MSDGNPNPPQGQPGTDRTGDLGLPRVVVAEDEALIRLDLTEMLADAGYEVVGEASDGQRAVELAFEHRPDLVVMDVAMPIVDGIEAASQIAAAQIAPVVILTAFSQRELVQRASAAGAMAYLVKPFALTDLVPAIELARSRFAEIATLHSRVDQLADQLQSRKLVERAKAILQQAHGLSESEAFTWIQRAAMDKRMSMAAVAEVVIANVDQCDS